MTAQGTDRTTLVLWLCLAQLAALLVYADHFWLERTMIGGNADLYAFVRERLAVFDLPPTFYSAQFQNAAYDDAIDYLVGIAGAETREPFRFRVIYIGIVGALTHLVSDCETIRSGCGIHAATFAAKLVNWICLLLTFAVLLRLAPEDRRGRAETLALAAAGTLSMGAFMTASFVMADIMSGLVFALAMLWFVQRRFWALVATVCAGILVKEIAIILGLLIVWELFRPNRVATLAILTGAALPAVVFVGIRVMLGADPLSVNYGWDVTEGYFEIRYFWMHAEGAFVPFITKFAAGVGVVGLLFLLTLRNAGRATPELWAILAVTIALIVANIFLASMVVRVAAPLVPLMAGALLAYGVHLSPMTNAREGERKLRT